MVKRLTLSALVLATLNGCGLFLPDDFPSYLPFVEGVYDLRAEMKTLGFTNPRDYEVVRGWLPRARHGKDWAFVHLATHNQGAQRFGVMALDKHTLSRQAWFESDGANEYYTAYLSETLKGWASANSEIQVNTGTAVRETLSDVTINQQSRAWFEGEDNFLATIVILTAMAPDHLVGASITYSEYNESWAGTMSPHIIRRQFPFSDPNPLLSLISSLIDLQTDQQGRIYFLLNYNQVGLVFSLSGSSELVIGVSIPYHGFPLSLSGDQGFTYITTEGPVIFREGKMIRYAPENGARVLDELSLPLGFRPLGFSVDQKLWLGWDEETGRVFLLRAWW